MARADKPPIFDPFAVDVSDGSDPDLFDEPDYMGTGFPAPAGVPVVPALSDFNWLYFHLTSGMRYAFQRGIADWDTNETDYDEFDILRDTDGKLYQLLGTATTGVAPSADPDWVLFHRAPTPMTGEDATDEIAAWRNAKRFRVTGKDHFGFDNGRILDFRENWDTPAVANKSATAASALWFGRWNTAIDNGGGTAGLISNPGVYATDLSTRPWGSLVTVNAFGQSVDAVSIVETALPIIKMSGACLVSEVDFSVNGASGPQTGTYLSVGIGDGTLAGNRMMGSISGGGALAYGAYIEANGGQPWSAYSRPNGGATSNTATVVSLTRNAPHRYRCIVVGTSDSDDSTARVIHMIDGAIVANHTVSLLNQMLSPFIRAYASQGEVCAITVGPWRIQVRLALGDVLI